MDQNHPLYLWVEDLETTGEKQGEGVLRSRDDEFCCLGRACEVYSKVTGEGYWEYNQKSAVHEFVIPGPRERLAGSLGHSVVQHWLGIDLNEENIYVGLNDVDKFSFRAIAAEVRVRHPKVFT